MTAGKVYKWGKGGGGGGKKTLNQKMDLNQAGGWVPPLDGPPNGQDPANAKDPNQHHGDHHVRFNNVDHNTPPMLQAMLNESPKQRPFNPLDLQHSQ